MPSPPKPPSITRPDLGNSGGQTSSSGSSKPGPTIPGLPQSQSSDGRNQGSEQGQRGNQSNSNRGSQSSSGNHNPQAGQSNRGNQTTSSNGSQGSLRTGATTGSRNQERGRNSGIDDANKGGLVQQSQRSGRESQSGSEIGTEDGTDQSNGGLSGQSGSHQASGPEILQGDSPTGGIDGEDEGESQEGEGDRQSQGGILSEGEGEGKDRSDSVEGSDEMEPGYAESYEPDSTLESVDDGWSVSNQLPTNEKVRSQGEPHGDPNSESQSGKLDGEGDVDSEGIMGGGADEAEGLGARGHTNIASYPSDSELESVLSSIDRNIRDDRSDQAERANDRASGPSLGNDAVLNDSSDGTGVNPDTGRGLEDGPSTAELPDEITGSKGSDKDGSYSSSEPPDIAVLSDKIKGDPAVVARQLRQAAMEETDPELKARLWEEFRRYQDKLK